MFNRRISDDLATLQETEDRAVARARVPGAKTLGNAAGAYVGVTSGLLPADPFDPTTGGRDGNSGTDLDGTEFYPFILGVDTPNDEGAYIMFSSATKKNYVN